MLKEHRESSFHRQRLRHSPANNFHPRPGNILTSVQFFFLRPCVANKLFGHRSPGKSFVEFILILSTIDRGIWKLFPINWWLDYSRYRWIFQWTIGVSREKLGARRCVSRKASLQLWAIPRRGEPRNELTILPSISKLASRRRCLPGPLCPLRSSVLIIGAGTGPLLGLRIMFRRWKKERRKETSGNSRCTVHSWSWWPRSVELLPCSLLLSAKQRSFGWFLLFFFSISDRRSRGSTRWNWEPSTFSEDSGNHLLTLQVDDDFVSRLVHWT